MLGRIVFYAAWSYRRLALENLRIAYGRESTEAERWIVARRHFASLGGNLLCGLKLPLMGEDAVQALCHGGGRSIPPPSQRSRSRCSMR